MSPLTEPVLKSLRDSLTSAIHNYQHYPPNLTAIMKAHDFVRFLGLFKHVVESTIRSIEVTQDALSLNVSYGLDIKGMRGTIEQIRQEVNALNVKHNKVAGAVSDLSAPTISKAEQKRRNDPKYDFDSAELSTRTLNCLRNEFPNGNMLDVTTKTARELLWTPNFGRKSLDELEEWLAHLGLKLAT